MWSLKSQRELVEKFADVLIFNQKNDSRVKYLYRSLVFETTTS
jgi:hypothetical protein